jgi:hypothetical protein
LSGYPQFRDKSPGNPNLSLPGANEGAGKRKREEPVQHQLSAIAQLPRATSLVAHLDIKTSLSSLQKIGCEVDTYSTAIPAANGPGDTRRLNFQTKNSESL